MTSPLSYSHEMTTETRQSLSLSNQVEIISYRAGVYPISKCQVMRALLLLENKIWKWNTTARGCIKA